MSDKKGLRKFLDVAQSFNPLEQSKEAIVDVAKEGLSKAADIVKNVQEGKMQIAEGLQAIQELKINTEAELEKARLSDIRDARSMNEKAMQSDDKFVRRFIYYLAAGTILIVAAMICLLYFVEIPKGNERIVDMALGSFIGAALTIFVFFFGSTHGSKEKNGLLSKLMDKS